MLKECDDAEREVGMRMRMDMDEEWMSLSLVDVIMIWSVQCRMAYGGIVRGMG